MNRRKFLSRVAEAGAAITISSLAAPQLARAATRLSFVSWGGSYGEFVKEYWIKPFTAETGIEVEYVSGPDLARAKVQVMSGNILWDVFDAAGSLAYAGLKEGLWELVDTNVVDPARFVRWPANGTLVPIGITIGGIGYDPSRTKDPPKNFVQLWDVKKFPGRRALRNRVSETLEIALLADGVAPDKLYPLDVDRAFRSLDRIKPYVKIWFSETAQGVTLIQTNEADFTYTFTSRVKPLKDSGASIDFSMEQCLGSPTYYTVLKGTKKKAEAMKFLEFVTRVPQQALLTNLGIPAVKGAEKNMSEEQRRWIPDFNNPKNVLIDDEYWGDHLVKLDRRFKEWILT